MSLFGLGISPGAALNQDTDKTFALSLAGIRAGFVASIPDPESDLIADARIRRGEGEHRRTRTAREERPAHSPRTTIKISSSEQKCLAEALYFEARGEGTAGQMAVAEVVVRRSKTSGYPQSVCGVVYQGNPGGTTGCQFSFACNGAMHRGREAGAWSRARNLATRIGTGKVALGNTTDRALFFHATSVMPHWPGLVRTAQIGKHVFYRRNGKWRGMGAAGRRIRSRALARYEAADTTTPRGGVLLPDGRIESIVTPAAPALDITVRPQMADTGA